MFIEPAMRFLISQVTTGPKVILNLWICLGGLVIKMNKILFNENRKERKIKKILYKYFITKLSRPSKQ